MSGPYAWKPAKAWPHTVDPYTRWLIDTAPNCLDAGQMENCADNHWFLVLLKEPEKKAGRKQGGYGLNRIDAHNLVWKPEGSEYAFLLTCKDFGGMAGELCQSGPETAAATHPSEPTAKDSSDHAKVDAQADAPTGRMADEVYAQLAPLDDAMIPEELYEPQLDDMSSLGINPAKAVIVGIIDDGINIAHEHFIDADGNPRVDCAWIQDGRLSPDGRRASSVLFGQELTASQIKGVLAQFDSEEKTLRALGLVDPTRSEPTTLSKAFSHGTFVLDALAGYSHSPFGHDGPLLEEQGRPAGRQTADAKDRRIVSVQLNRRVTGESSGALYTLFAILGLEYIVDRSRRIAKQLRKPGGKKIPLVMNFSYGLSGGPHNGDHLFERFVQKTVETLDKDPDLGPLLVPMPVGNRFLLKGHAHVAAEKAGDHTLNLNWITQPQDPSPNYLEIWLPKPAGAQKKRGKAKQPVTLTLTPPFGDKEAVFSETVDIASLNGTENRDLHDSSGTIVGRLTFDCLDAANAPSGPASGPLPNSYPKLRILIALAPTRPVADETASIPPGSWNVSVTAKLSKGEFLEAWIQRDDSPPFFRRQGRQSYLEHQSWTVEGQRQDELNEHVQPLPEEAGLSKYGTINGLATSSAMIRVSGYRLKDGSRAVYAGAPHAGMPGEDVSAASDRSRVFAGLVGTGGRSGSTQIMNGTSVSAPIVGRSLADFLAENRFQTAEEARKAYLTALGPGSPIVRNLCD
ncbi:hypothetical protein E1180_14125 [Roseibium denhamense]|uniref:Peptidase S8/S53 domain-containing protein n=1 Tax=Roseibium denhamense TaxID=76305 RepID=A0ABY1NCJ7_9HYPH|nr:hypothetical protein [Roseibium denhamense]MTI06654.1 hypothetical protein [Roseibium denhamense]SMP06320.1 hypothetical protein SAMN06265374_0777 [Roseibium denhamense]